MLFTIIWGYSLEGFGHDAICPEKSGLDVEFQGLS